MSTAVERYEQPQSGAVAVLGEREIASIQFQAKAIATLDPRLKSDKLSPEERQETAVALALTLHNLGLPITITNAKKLHLIGGEVVESAQLLIGLLARNGHEVRVVEETPERVLVVGLRHGRGEPHRVTYTVEQAAASGALDEWVEVWEKTGSGKSYPKRHFLVFEGKPNTAPVPEWAQREIDRGQVKRMDAWHKYRTDMLVNRALRRLARRMGGDALLGVDDSFDLSRPPLDMDPETGEVPTRPRQEVSEEEEIVDAEVVAPPAPEDAPAAEPEPETAALADELVSGAWVQNVAIACRELDLDDADRHALIALATGGRVSSTKQVLRSEAGVVRDLITKLKAGSHQLVQVDEEGNVELREVPAEPDAPAAQYALDEEPF